MPRLPFASLIVVGVLGVASVGTAAMAADGNLKVRDLAPPLAVSTWLHAAEVKALR